MLVQESSLSSSSVEFSSASGGGPMNHVKYCSKASSGSFHLLGLSAASISSSPSPSSSSSFSLSLDVSSSYFVVANGWFSSNGRPDSNSESESPSASISARVLRGSCDNFEDEICREADLTGAFFGFVVVCLDFSSGAKLGGGRGIGER